MTHKHWIIIAYNRRDDMGNFHDVVTLEYIADSFDQALVMARADYQPEGPESGYRLNSMIQHFDGTCITGGGHH